MTLPALSPIEAPDLVCTECSAVMRRVIQKHKSTGRLEKILYYCDTKKCEYGQSVSMEHKNAQNSPYVPPMPEKAPPYAPKK
jgi:hypothetical protein